MRRFCIPAVLSFGLLVAACVSGRTASQPSADSERFQAALRSIFEKKRWPIDDVPKKLQAAVRPPLVVARIQRTASIARSSAAAAARPELVVRTGAGREVLGLAFSPDGRYFATGGLTSSIQIWDAVSRTQLRTLDGHTARVNAIAVSPDSRLLVTGGGDRSARVWDVKTGRQLHRIRIEPYAAMEFTARMMGNVDDVAFSPDGSLLALATDSVPRILETGHWTELHALQGHEEDAEHVSFSADGKRLLSVSSSEPKLRIWDVSSGALSASLDSGGKGVRDAAFSPDGRYIAALVERGGRDRVRVFDALTGGALRDFDAPKVGSCLAFGPDSRKLAVGGSDGSGGALRVEVVDVTTGQRAVRLEAVRSSSWHFAGSSLDIPIARLAFSPDGTRLFGVSGPRILEWDVASGALVGQISSRVEMVRSARLDPESERLVTLSGAGDRALEGQAGRLWDLAMGGVSRTTPPSEEFQAAESSPDAGLIVSGRADGFLSVWRSDTGELLHRIRAHRKAVESVAVSPDGRLAATGSGDHTVRIWDLETGRRLRELRGHTSVVLALAFDADGEHLASGGADKTARLWRVRDGEQLQLLTHDEWVRALALSPDGRTLASVQSFLTSQQTKLWSLEDGRLQQILIEGDSLWSGALAFTPDGERLAIALADNGVGLWRPGEDRMTTLYGHRSMVNSIQFLDGGRRMLTSSGDGSVALWDVEGGRQLASLISLKGGTEWAVVAPNGLFDGSPGALAQLAWRFDGDTFDIAPIEIFFNEFYHPGLLTDILSGAQPAAPSNIADLDRRQPTVLLSAPKHAGQGTHAEREVELEIVLRAAGGAGDSGSGARDLRLFRDGSLVKAWRGELLANGSERRFGARVPISAGPNRFSAYAFNRNNIKSTDATLVVRGANALETPARLVILAIGIDRYANPSYDLRYAVSDALAFAQTLRASQDRIGRFETTDVVALTDAEATRANILAAFAKLAGDPAKGPLPDVLQDLEAVGPEDGVVVFFAGHGTTDRDRFYMLPHDIGYAGPLDQLDERGFEKIVARGISDRDLERRFEGIDAGWLLLVIDACNSGQALEAEEKRRGPMNTRGLAQLAYEKGMYVLTAAQGYQAALEAARLGHGFLTYALVEEGLKTSSADSAPTDGDVSVREWLDYAAARVPSIHREFLATGSRGIRIPKNRKSADAELEWRVQRPRVFYRREAREDPLIVAQPNGAGPARALK